jgi:hypothetical protein
MAGQLGTRIPREYALLTYNSGSVTNWGSDRAGDGSTMGRAELEPKRGWVKTKFDFRKLLVLSKKCWV